MSKVFCISDLMFIESKGFVTDIYFKYNHDKYHVNKILTDGNYLDIECTTELFRVSCLTEDKFNDVLTWRQVFDYLHNFISSRKMKLYADGNLNSILEFLLDTPKLFQDRYQSQEDSNYHIKCSYVDFEVNDHDIDHVNYGKIVRIGLSDFKDHSIDMWYESNPTTVLYVSEYPKNNNLITSLIDYLKKENISHLDEDGIWTFCEWYHLNNPEDTEKDQQVEQQFWEDRAAEHIANADQINRILDLIQKKQPSISLVEAYRDIIVECARQFTNKQEFIDCSEAVTKHLQELDK